MTRELKGSYNTHRVQLFTSTWSLRRTSHRKTFIRSWPASWTILLMTFPPLPINIVCMKTQREKSPCSSLYHPNKRQCSHKQLKGIEQLEKSQKSNRGQLQKGANCSKSACDRVRRPHR